MENDKDGIKFDVVGIGAVTLKFWLAMVNGDTAAQDVLCCHYSNYISNLARMTRSCNISTEDGDSVNFQCMATT